MAAWFSDSNVIVSFIDSLNPEYFQNFVNKINEEKATMNFEQIALEDTKAKAYLSSKLDLYFSTQNFSIEKGELVRLLVEVEFFSTADENTSSIFLKFVEKNRTCISLLEDGTTTIANDYLIDYIDYVAHYVLDKYCLN